MDVIANLIVNAINKFLASIMENALTSFVSFTGNEMALALQILDSAYVQSTVHLAQAVAGSLLALKVGAEALQVYILHTHGDPGADPGGLLKRSAVAAAVIGAGPWLVQTVYTWGNDLAQSVASLSSVNPNPVNFIDTLVSLGTTPTLILIADIAALAIWVLILIQTGIRAVEVASLAAVGPFMAVGLTRADEGVAAVWWRELVVLSGSQALQTFLVKGFLATIVTFTFNSDVLKLFLLIGWLWVAFKTPSVLRQFAYHTGLGGAIGQVGQTGGTWYIMRRVFMRG